LKKKKGKTALVPPISIKLLNEKYTYFHNLKKTKGKMRWYPQLVYYCYRKLSVMGFPLRAANLRRQQTKVLAVRSFTRSRVTACVTQHVNRAI